MTTNTEAMTLVREALEMAIGREPQLDQACRAALAALQPQAPAPSLLAREEANHEVTIWERDRAEEALSDLVALVLGRPPEWSNHYGYADALDECRDKLAAPAPVAVPAGYWLAPEIEEVAMVDGYEQPSDPVYRIEVGGYCADFPTRTAAENFRGALLSAAPPAPSVPAECLYPHRCEAATCDCKGEIVAMLEGAAVSEMPAPSVSDQPGYRAGLEAGRQAVDAIPREKVLPFESYGPGWNAALERADDVLRALIDQPTPSGEAQELARLRAENDRLARAWEAKHASQTEDRAEAKRMFELAQGFRERAEKAEAERDRLREDLDGFLSSALVDATMEGPRLYGWNRSALDRAYHAAQGRQQEGQTNA